jgi:hypothetical protein
MYKIVGADQKEYGPAAAEQVRAWISEGRANSNTIARFENGAWKPLSTFPEFTAFLAAFPATTVPPPMLSNASTGTRDSVPNYLIPAIFCTACCCLPFGIPAIVYATQVNSKSAAGDVVGAQKASAKARMWCWIAVLSGVAMTIIYSILAAIGTKS